MLLLLLWVVVDVVVVVVVVVADIDLLLLLLLALLNTIHSLIIIDEPDSNVAAFLKFSLLCASYNFIAS